MKPNFTAPFAQLAAVLAALCTLAFVPAAAAPVPAELTQPSFVIDKARANDADAIGLRAFAQRFDEPLVAVIVELDAAPGFIQSAAAKSAGAGMKAAVLQHHENLARQQDALIARANADGVALLLRVKDVDNGHGAKLRAEYRFSYLSNGFVAYVAQSKLAELASVPGVRTLSNPIRPEWSLDHSVNYVLGRAPSIAARRLAVYGATQEFNYVGGNTVPAPGADGTEGQGIYLGVVDSGMHYEHPMLGGTGAMGPLPQRPPQAATPSDHKKVVYWYNLGGAAMLDDNGHGTHVSSTAGGFLVDGNTPVVTPTVGAPFGPTPGGVAMHGVAPQTKLMGWPVCNGAGNCPGDIELAIEDAVSPLILSGTGDGGSIPTGVAKPIADVLNLSLGGGTDSASAAARSVNNAVLAGLVVAAAAGNDGPGAGTTGSPCVATLAICVASAHDPGSTAGANLLAAGEVGTDICADTNGACVGAPPPAETGDPSRANNIEPGSNTDLRAFPMSGGGPLPLGSVSARYVYVDRDQSSVPASVTGRIALLENGTGTFFQIVNPVALLNPRAILLITNTGNATALAVANGVPVYTISTSQGEYLKQQMLTGAVTPNHGAVSRLPMRVDSARALAAFAGEVSDFSSRGPNANTNANYRTVKPDLAATGQGVLAATTPVGSVGVGAADPSGYITISGTSMASPHVAGAAALVRQRLRTLGLDSINPADPQYVQKRFRASTVTRAMLTNTATDLRTGSGGDDPVGTNPPYTIQDVGAGLIDIDAATHADAIMTSPTILFDVAPNEFTPPGFGGTLPIAPGTDGNLSVPLPTASFGNVESLGIVGSTTSFRAVTIEDISGSGGGSYALTRIDDVLTNHPAVIIDFYNAARTAPITSVTVPAGGSATFNVRVVVDGEGALVEGSMISWYVHATHQGSAKRLRMPFQYRAVRKPVANLGVAQNVTIANANPPVSPSVCHVDPDNSWAVNWTYTHPTGAPPLSAFRVQRATYNSLVFSDDNSEPLVGGANSIWSGSPQWTSSLNPSTADESYYIPDSAEQNEALTLTMPIALPAGGGASLELRTNIRTEEGFDFAHIEANSNGGAFQKLGQRSGLFDGTLNFDISPFAGTATKLQFRMTSDLNVSDIGWHVDDIAVRANNFALRAETGPTLRSYNDSAATPGTYYYRVGGLFFVDGQFVIGPYSNVPCVTVPRCAPIADRIFRGSFEAPGCP